jgi:hypothetical protein
MKSLGLKASPRLAGQKQKLQRNRNGGLFRVRVVVLENCLTPPTWNQNRDERMAAAHCKKSQQKSITPLSLANLRDGL